MKAIEILGLQQAFENLHEDHLLILKTLKEQPVSSGLEKIINIVHAKATQIDRKVPPQKPKP